MNEAIHGERGAPAPPSAGGIIPPSEPPKEPIAALLLNIFFVCAGYFFIGQWQKGVATLGLVVCELVAVFVFTLATLGCGYCLAVPLTLGVHAALAIDCYLQANVLKSGRAIGQWTFFNGYVQP